MAEMEIEFYKREMRRRPQPVSTTAVEQNKLARNKRNRTARHGYRTRATRGEEPEEDDDFEVSLLFNFLIIRLFEWLDLDYFLKER